jgi:hypothetical protein
MKPIIAALAGTALLALAAPVSAQTLQPPMNPTPMQTAPPSGFTTVNQLQPQALPPWMQDDGSSSDHPVHNPGDFSSGQLNSQVQGGIPVPPGQGFPADGFGR